MIFVRNDGAQAARRTDFDISYGDGALTVTYTADNSELFCPYSKDNEPLYEGCVVELFLAEKGDRDSYLEYEFSPCGAVFCGRITYDGAPHLELLPVESITHCDIEAYGSGYRVKARITVDIDIDCALFNAYRIECKEGDTEQELFALFPTKCATFHRPEFMRPLRQYLS